MAEATAHADVLNESAQGQIRSIIDRVNRLEIEKEEIAEQIKEVYAEAKGNGFDVKILKKAVRLLKQDRAKRQEEEAILDLYMTAAGDGPAFERAEPAQRADTSLGVASITVTSADGASDAVTPDTLAVGERIKRGTDVEDALYDQAVALVRRDDNVSASYIQRCLMIEFNDAVSMLERMEDDGIVSPYRAELGRREILQAEAA